MLDQLLKWDREALIFINNLGEESYDMYWLAITLTANWIPLFLLLLLILFWKCPIKEALVGFITVVALVLFVLLLTNFTKEIIARPRPSNDEDLKSLIRVLRIPTDYSFFSGHAASSFAITSFWFLLVRKKIKWAWAFFIWPVLFSVSRIYIGVHFPIDILAGALVGTLSAFGFYVLYRRFTAPYLP